jgi:hypothetical protein
MLGIRLQSTVDRSSRKMRPSGPFLLHGAGTGVKAATLWSAEILSSPEQALGLAAEANALLECRAAEARPAFFLASIESKSWIPRIVVVKCGATIQGIVYAKERKILGLPTGLVYVDASLDSMVVAAGGNMARVLKVAISRLLQNRRIQGLRLLIPSNERFEIPLRQLQLSNRMDVHRCEAKNHCVLDLSDNYETFLNRLGTTTRRNFRYYRRRSEAAGNEYVFEMKFDEFQTAAFYLLEKGVTGAKADGLKRALRMLQTAECPMMAGLRDSNGNWLAIVGGWYEAGRAVIFCQMNNEKEHPQSSLCTVLRGYLFETLIGKSRTKVLFWAGVGGQLMRHCEFLPTTAVYFDRPNLIWRTFRMGFAAVLKFLPDSFRHLARWVSPAMSQNSI